MLKVTSRVRTGTDQLTLEDAKAFMRVDGDGDDTLITSLISEARDLIEAYCSCTITQSTITLLATARTELQLPYEPVISVVSVKDLDGEDVDYTYNGFYIKFGTGEYSVTAGDPAFTETLTEYTAGWDDVPDGLMLGWKEICSYLYENRGDDTGINMLLSQNKNLQPYRNLIWV